MNIDAINTEILNLEDELKRLRSKNSEITVATNQAASLCFLSLKKIEKIVLLYGFDSTENEIDFFKI